MITIDCPWCDGALTIESMDALRCDGCSVEVEFAPDPVAELAAAA